MDLQAQRVFAKSVNHQIQLESYAVFVTRIESFQAINQVFVKNVVVMEVDMNSTISR